MESPGWKKNLKVKKSSQFSARTRTASVPVDCLIKDVLVRRLAALQQRCRLARVWNILNLSFAFHPGEEKWLVVHWP